MIKRREKIKVTHIRRQRLAAPERPLRAACRLCQREVELLSRDRASNVLDVAMTTLDRMMDDGLIHRVETVSGNVWVCKDSLFVR